MRQCEYCDDDFMPNCQAQRFCLPECRKQAKPQGRRRCKPRKCAQCRKEFTPKGNFSICCGINCYSIKRYAVPENKAVVLKRHQNRMEDPKYAAKCRKYQADYRVANKDDLDKKRKKKQSTQEYRRKINEKNRKRYADDPEYRRKILEISNNRYHRKITVGAPADLVRAV